MSLTFKISTGMHFITLRSMVCISYRCRNGMTSYCVVTAQKGSDFDGFMTLKEGNLWYIFEGPSCYGNELCTHFISAMV